MALSRPLQSIPIARTLCLAAAVCLSGASAASAQTMSPPPAPPLPPPSGPTVSVSTVGQLQSAVDALTSGTTILVQPGTYRLSRTLRIRNNVTNVSLRGATGNRDDVIILGTGMNTPGVDIALKVENAQDVQIADLSIGQAFNHPIQLKGEMGAERVHIYNVRLFDAGEQFLKSTVDFRNPNGVDDTTVEYSLFEFTKIGPADGYTQGIDAHHASNWVIRHNLFRNIRVPSSAPMKNRPAILMWSGSRDTLVYGNTMINCERGVIFGLGPQSGFTHSHWGGAIFNNVIYRTDPVNADAGISVWDSPNTVVYHNTVIQNGTYKNAIEYRFPGTTGVRIENNLTDGAIARRDGAQAVLLGNITSAGPELFVNAATGDLHLQPTATGAVDRGVDVSEVTADWDGEARPSGAGWDVGADEVGGSSGEGPSNQAPVAQFTASPASGAAPLTVTFDGRASSDPDGGALTYRWAFGNGESASGAQVTHAYTSAGAFTATLTVQDPDGASASGSQSISVSAAPGGPAPPESGPAAPTDLRATLGSDGIRLIWSDSTPGDNRIFVERAVTQGGAFIRIAQLGLDATTFLDRTTSHGWAGYRVQAFSRETGERSGYSNVVWLNLQ